MAAGELGAVGDVLEAQGPRIQSVWTSLLAAQGSASGRLSEGEFATECAAFLQSFRAAIAAGGTAVNDPPFDGLRQQLDALSRSRALAGFSPGETATFVFSFKQPVTEALRGVPGLDGQALADQLWAFTRLVDELGIYTFEIFQKVREEVILRQQREIAELSTPVVKLWQRIIALPLIGTLDSERTQVVMENLLQSIVDEGAEIAIIDITGVPTVDTLVAQHLLKTVAAARLMGADCIISGIRPQIAQTMVHLGVELDVVSKASLADAFAVALSRTGRRVVKLGA